MELVAIDPFISSLDEKKRSLIKEEIAKKFFGNADAMEINSKDEYYPAMDKLTSIEDLLQICCNHFLFYRIAHIRQNAIILPDARSVIFPSNSMVRAFPRAIHIRLRAEYRIFYGACYF